MATTLALLARVGLLAAAVLGALARPVIASPQKSRDGRFSHTDHVREFWPHSKGRARGTEPGADLEYDRDCRGCHDYESEPDQRVKPTETCNRCHEGQGPRPGVGPAYSGAALVDPRAEKWTKERDTGLERFNHYEHRGSHCALCHRPEGQPEVPALLPKDSIRSAFACGDCHGLRGTASHVREGFDEGIDVRLARRKDTDFGVFRHDQHLAPEGLATVNPVECKTCHVEIETADAESMGKKQFSTEACKVCHEGGTFVTAQPEKKSRTSATFLHGQHLSPAALAGNAELDAKRCGACHAYDAALQTFDLGARFRGAGPDDLHVYEGCISCHGDKTVSGHGSIEDCRKCHDFESDGASGVELVQVWAQSRGKVQVQRADPAAFEFGPQSHKFITTLGTIPGKDKDKAKVDQACATCHLARIPALPSRLTGKRFSHATHRGECLSCHQGMDAARGPADSVYELAHCKKCHRTEELTARPGAPEARPMARFSHHDHRARSCVDCHVAKGERIELQPDVGACGKCHGHDRPSTTQHSRDDILACKYCHVPGVPEAGVRVPVPRLSLERIEGERTHPRADKDCKECHRQPRSEASVSDGRTRSDYKMTKDYKDPHGVRDKDHYYHKNSVGSRTTWCIDCHWALPESISDQLAGVSPQPWMDKPPDVWLPEFGNLMDAGFPGIPP